MSASIPQSRIFRDSSKKNSLRALLFNLLPRTARSAPPRPVAAPSRRIHTPSRPDTHTADLCKQYLRLKHPDKPGSVEAFILRIETSGNSAGIANWEQFIDRDSITDDSLRPLNLAFGQWLQLLKIR